jgi:hypothetical protein
MAREQEVHKLLTRERILGLDLVKGVKIGAVAPLAVAGEEQTVPEAEDCTPEGEQVTGLPLFGDEADPDT